MNEFKDREKRKFNEMTEREKQLNSKPLNALETMDIDIHNRLLPGYSKPEDKQNYRRFVKRGISPGKLGMLHTHRE
jgi:hypothetical protein